MRVAVTGATGFLGRAVVAVLADIGHHVIAISRSGTAVPGAMAAIRGDIRDPRTIRAAVATVDGVCHLAGRARVRDSIADPIGYWQTNTVGTINVLNALAVNDKPKRIVLASTGAVYGTPERQPSHEDTPPDPHNPYSASKLAADLVARDVAQCGTIGAITLRAFNIAGSANGYPDPDETRLIPKALAVQAGRASELTINGDGSAVRDFVHVLDMADAFARAFDACQPGQWRAYNVGSGRGSSVADVLRVVEEVTGRPVPVRYQPPAPEPPVLLADSSRIERELGWQAMRSDLTTIVKDGWDAVTSTYSVTE
jgi:UDP-glucose 4-epimerase